MIRSIVAVLMFASTAAAADLDDVRALPPTLREIVTEGRWRDGNTPGFYRIVRADAPDGRTGRLFIQWITAPTGTATGIAASAEVDEISAMGVSVHDLTLLSSGENALRVGVRIVDHDGRGEERLELIAETPGRYRLTRVRRP